MYYIYKTTNLINEKIYIGYHKSEDIENDTYIGSGKLLWIAINKYGIENFKREILFEYENVNDALEKEKELVNLEFIRRKDTYNICIGGIFGWDTKNRINITKDGVLKFIKKDSLDEWLKIGWNICGTTSGTICFTNKETGNLTYVNKNNLEIYKNSKEWEIGNKKSGINKNSIYINKESINKRIKIEDLEKYLNEGWKKGMYQKTKGTKRIYNPLTNETKNINNEKELLEYLEKGWNFGIGYSSNIKNSIYITKNSKNKRIKKEDFKNYEKEGWKKGMYNKKYNKN